MKVIHKILQRMYFIWMALWFVLGFMMILPFILIILQNPKWQRYYRPITWCWAKMFYILNFIPVRKVWHFKSQKKQRYIYCPNHFAFLDIPLLTLTVPHFYAFVGLHDLKKIPIFGYMYRKIHITVDRSNPRDRYATFQKSKEALKNGQNLIMFPEGGIWTKDFPELSPFKEGPFRIAIEMQMPIVPVTIPFNWRMMPIFDYNRLAWHRQEVIFHEPISTVGMTLKDVNALQQRTYQIINEQLKISNKIN